MRGPLGNYFSVCVEICAQYCVSALLGSVFALSPEHSVAVQQWPVSWRKRTRSARLDCILKVLGLNIGLWLFVFSLSLFWHMLNTTASFQTLCNSSGISHPSIQPCAV
jgi:hypothetical protein